MWAKLRYIHHMCELLSFTLDATFYRYSSATLTVRDKMSRNCRPRVRVILFELFMSFSMALEEVRSFLTHLEGGRRGHEFIRQFF